MRFKRFTNTEFLRHIGRDWLKRLFDRLAPDLAARGIALPSPQLDDDTYFAELTEIAMHPEALPEKAIEDLYAIESMSSYQASERLFAAAKQLGIKYEGTIPSSEDMVVQLYLSHPGLVIRKHNEMKLVRLRSFEYFCRIPGRDMSEHFRTPGPAVLDRITEDINAWCRQENRGDQTVRVDVYPIDSKPVRRTWDFKQQLDLGPAPPVVIQKPTAPRVSAQAQKPVDPPPARELTQPTFWPEEAEEDGTEGKGTRSARANRRPH